MDTEKYALGIRTKDQLVYRIGHPLIGFESAKRAAIFSAKSLVKDLRKFPDQSVRDSETKEILYCRDIIACVVLDEARNVIGIDYPCTSDA